MSRGYNVMTFGGGQWTAISWHATKEGAEASVEGIIARGVWSGFRPKVQEA